MSADPYGVIEDAADRLASRFAYGEKNRLALLMVHGVIGIAVGVAMVLEGIPKTFVDVVTSDAHAAAYLYLTPMIGGATLLLGLAMKRNLLIEAMGMALMLGWDSFMAGMFIYARAIDPTALVYPVAVYGGLGALMACHLFVLITFLIGGERHGRR